MFLLICVSGLVALGTINAQFLLNVGTSAPMLFISTPCEDKLDCSNLGRDVCNVYIRMRMYCPVCGFCTPKTSTTTTTETTTTYTTTSTTITSAALTTNVTNNATAGTVPGTSVIG